MISNDDQLSAFKITLILTFSRRTRRRDQKMPHAFVLRTGLAGSSGFWQNHQGRPGRRYGGTKGAACIQHHFERVSDTMGRFVIVAYSPKSGMSDALLVLVQKHLSVLRGEGLVTDRPASIMRAADGTIVEVFEWRSAECISKAHGLPEIQAMWGEFAAACDYRPLNSLAECQQLFAEFDGVE